MTRSSSRFTPPSGESGLAEDTGCYCETVIRVLVVEDESWLRAALVEAFSSSESLTVAGAFGSLAAVRQAILQGLAFDAALVDLGLPDGSGLSLLPELRAANASAGLLVFTMFDEPETVFAALRAGARGYLLKSTPLAQLASALLEVVSGGSPMTPAVARLVLDSWAPLTEAAPKLSSREEEILTLLARGHTYADVGRALGIQLGTVQSYVKTLYEKLCVASKAEAAVVAIKRGLA